MSKHSDFGKVLRIIAIVLMALTAAFMLMGGVGTSCVAWALEKFPSFSAIAPVQWLYRLVSVVTTIVAIAGLWATATVGPCALGRMSGSDCPSRERWADPLRLNGRRLRSMISLRPQPDDAPGHRLGSGPVEDHPWSAHHPNRH